MHRSHGLMNSGASPLLRVVLLALAQRFGPAAERGRRADRRPATSAASTRPWCPSRTRPGCSCRRRPGARDVVRGLALPRPRALRARPPRLRSGTACSASDAGPLERRDRFVGPGTLQIGVAPRSARRGPLAAFLLRKRRRRRDRDQLERRSEPAIRTSWRRPLSVMLVCCSSEARVIPRRACSWPSASEGIRDSLRVPARALRSGGRC